MRVTHNAGLAVCLALLAGCGTEDPTAVRARVQSVDGPAIGLFEQHPKDWLSNGRSYGEQRWNGVKTETEPQPAPAAYSNAGRLIVFELGGGAVRVAERRPVPPLFSDDTPQPVAHVAAGAQLYLTHCSMCHDVVGEAGVFPDLRRMSAGSHAAFDSIVRGGLLRAGGMASFADVLSAEDTQSIRAYVVDWAQRSRRGAE